jgi:hypothetical protein
MAKKEEEEEVEEVYKDSAVFLKVRVEESKRSLLLIVWYHNVMRSFAFKLLTHLQIPFFFSVGLVGAAVHACMYVCVCNILRTSWSVTTKE